MIQLISKLCKKLNRQRIINDRENNVPYMERNYVFLKDRKKFPFNIFLHKFLKSDDPILHDHPWNYITIILKGGYWEWIPIFEKENIIGQKKMWRGIGHIRRCKAESYHWIELEPGIDAYTLFIPGISKREWGFLTHNNWLKQEWIPHDKYTR